MKKTTRLLAMILCLVMCFSLVACGNKQEASPAPVESKPDESKVADKTPEYVAPEASAEYEETVISAYQSDLAAPGAYESSDAVGSFFTNMTFRTVTFNNPDTGELEGILAEKWETVNDDPKVWDITLKPGVKFHDGSTLTAEDLKFTWEFCAPGTGNTVKNITTASRVEKIEVVDDLVCRFYLKAAMPDFPTYLDQKVLSKTAYDTLGPEKFGRIGCGPYYYDEELSQSGVQFACTRFEDYFEGTEKYPTKHFIFKVIPDHSTMVAALQNGEIDFMHNFSTSNALILDADPNIELWQRSGANSYFMGFNYRKEIWHNADLRRALAMSIDKDAIVNGNFDGVFADRSENLCVPTGAGYIEVEPVGFDPDTAKKWLEDNGYAGMTIEILSNITQKTNCEIIQAYLAKVGITVTINYVEATAWSESLRTLDYDIFCNYAAYQGALLSIFERMFLSGGASNTFNYSDPEFDELFNNVLNAPTYDGMIEEFHKLLTWFSDQQVVVPLAIPKYLAASQKDVLGFALAPTTNWQDFSTVYIPARG